jgi:hypothetical protein
MAGDDCRVQVQPICSLRVAQNVCVYVNLTVPNGNSICLAKCSRLLSVDFLLLFCVVCRTISLLAHWRLELKLNEDETKFLLWVLLYSSSPSPC